MMLYELIERLQVIARCSGDLLVLHHDDYDEFVVDDIEIVPASGATLAHVILTGTDLYLQDDGTLCDDRIKHYHRTCTRHAADRSESPT